MTRGERGSGRNDSGANGKVGETTRILSQLSDKKLSQMLGFAGILTCSKNL